MSYSVSQSAFDLKVGGNLLAKGHTFRVLERVSAGGTHALLYKVTDVDSPGSVYLAKFFNKVGVCEYDRSEGKLGGDDQRAFKRFKKEAKFLKKFDHPNIVRYIDKYDKIGSSQACADECFYVMEYLKGMSLSALILAGSVSSERFVEIAKGIANGICEIHQKGVIHRDMHPGNVFLADGVPKILDFGCAVGGGITKPYDYRGWYNPIGGRLHRGPEAENPSLACPRSDIFSLGLTLLEVATSQLISNRVHAVEQRPKWIAGAMSSLTGSPSKLSVKKLLGDMLRDDPNQRPTGKEVLDRLNAMRTWKVRDLVGPAILAGAVLAMSALDEYLKSRAKSSDTSSAPAGDGERGTRS